MSKKDKNKAPKPKTIPTPPATPENVEVTVQTGKC